MKKITLLLGLVTFNSLLYAQNGLEKVIVERYYISTAADAAGSIAPNVGGGVLPEGSVTYRVYADMLPGYKFQALYGNSDHPLKVSTTTSFFNNEDRGALSANDIASAQLRNNTVALDSWFSVGASATGQFGVLKSDDNGLVNLVSANTLLKNNVARMGIPLTTQDGNIAGSPEAVTFVGFPSTNNPLDIFGALSQIGNSIVLNDNAISALSGAVGPTAENRILLGQFTTDGVFRFEFNIKIGTPTAGVSQRFVASNALVGEITIPTLILEPNIPPVVSITSPSNAAQIITGTAMTLTANASDPDVTGAITSVQFYLDGSPLGIADVTAPYEASYTAVAGAHTLYAIATDNSADADQTTSTTVNFSVANNQAPTVTVSAASSANVGDVVTLSSTATDVDGTVSQVEFFVDNASVGFGVKVGTSTTYTLNWTATIGAHTIKAIATDNSGATTISSIININVQTVVQNTPPTITLTSVTTANVGDVVAISATASDDGTVTQVEFFVDNSSIGIVTSFPYTKNWTATVGAHTIKAIATDNSGATTTSSIININVQTVVQNTPPTITLTSVTTANVGDVVAISATASDDGTVTQVEFFVDNSSIGIVTSFPYTKNWTATVGAHTIKAIATDNSGATTTSSIININVQTVVQNTPPTITLTSVTTANVGDVVAISATASDDGTVTQVEFFVDNSSIGIVTSLPYTKNWTAAVGSHSIKAVATDNSGATTTSSITTIQVQSSSSQKGLEGIIVEKYYISTATDAAGSITAEAGLLPEGSVTYRVYADMLPGYKFKALYGNENHPLKVATTTKFFNNEDRGKKTANDIASIQLKNNTVALDSWFSVGASATGQFGVLKSEDNGAVNLVSANTLLKNNVADIGIPLTTQDGNMAGTPEQVTIVGITTELDIFDATSQVGGSCTINDGAFSALSGAAGPTAENRILLGQFTTDGIFTFELNVRIGNSTPGYSETYVASNPIAGEFSIPSLILAPNGSQILSIKAPLTAIVDEDVKITATITDDKIKVTQVEFFVDDVSVGIDNTVPSYEVNWKAKIGSHTIKAIATVTDGSKLTSSSSTIDVQLVGLNELSNSNFSVNVFPNPANDLLTINLINLKNNQDVNLSIFDFKGAFISTTSINVSSNDFKHKLDVSNLKSGVYFMNITTENETIVEKIIIE